MDKQNKERVSYRFYPETVKLLERVQADGLPKYRGRSLTWLIEEAIYEQYKDKVEGNPHP